MYLKYTVCLFLVACAVCVRSDDDDDDLNDVVRLMAQDLHDLHAFVGDSFKGLESFFNSTIGSRMDRIETLLRSLEKRQLLAEMCTEDTCNGNGTCDLTEDWQHTVCHCETGYKGEHCQFVEGVCDAALRKSQQAPLMLGRFIPRCSEDGSYDGVQYRGSVAFCFTPDGKDIEGYSARSWESEGMNCQCARDWYDNQHDGSAEKRHFDCAPNGNNNGGRRVKKKLKLKPADLNHKRCDKDDSTGLFGTTERECNATAKGKDGCGFKCCGRGYKSESYTVKERCSCVFRWCCEVECQVCTRTKIRHTCY